MECNKYVDEKTGETGSAEFREHLAGCPGCARDVEELNEVRSLYRAASTEKYRGGVPRVRRFRGAWLPLAAAAAVLLGVFGLVLSGPRDGATTKVDSDAPPAVFVRIHLEPWGSDLRVSNALDDCWQTLERLETTR
jgi:anti-sigma factor RsiW